jgi:hypothetical protein
MRKLLLLSLIFVLFVCSSNKKTDNKNLPSFLLSAWQKSITPDGILIETAIINNSSDALSYFTMSCGWESFYRIDSKGYFIKADLCYMNREIIIKIPPYQSIRRMLIIKRNMLYAQLPPTKIRIGFDFIKPDSKITATSLSSFTGNMIWSEPFDLK